MPRTRVARKNFREAKRISIALRGEGVPGHLHPRMPLGHGFHTKQTGKIDSRVVHSLRKGPGAGHIPGIHRGAHLGGSLKIKGAHPLHSDKAHAITGAVHVPKHIGPRPTKALSHSYKVPKGMTRIGHRHHI